MHVTLKPYFQQGFIPHRHHCRTWHILLQDLVEKRVSMEQRKTLKALIERKFGISQRSKGIVQDTSEDKEDKRDEKNISTDIRNVKE
jgi:hypothetical protein